MVLLVLAVPYVRSMIKSTTRPSPISFFGWASLATVAAIAQASKGIDWSLAVPVLTAVGAFSVAFFSIRFGRAAWTRADVTSVVIGISALVLWTITKEPLTAIILVIVADLAVTVPTLIKTYSTPESEPFWFWVTYTSAATATIIATRNTTLYNLFYPIYDVLGALVITFLAARKPKTLS